MQCFIAEADEVQNGLILMHVAVESRANMWAVSANRLRAKFNPNRGLKYYTSICHMRTEDLVCIFGTLTVT